MNFTQALSLLVNAATAAPATRCSGCGGDMGGMSMWFHTGSSETVLFKEWIISTDGGLVGSAIGIFFLAVFYEAWKFGRHLLAQKMQHHSKGDKATLWSMPHVVQTLMHAVQYVLSYFLMFIFMTYNVWLCLAIVVGGAVGYFLFGWKNTSLDLTEHCH